MSPEEKKSLGHRSTWEDKDNHDTFFNPSASSIRRIIHDLQESKSEEQGAQKEKKAVRPVQFCQKALR